MFTYPVTLLDGVVGGGGGGGGAATLVQSAIGINTDDDTGTVTLTDVTAGNSIFVLIESNNTSNGTYTTTDDVNAGSYTVDGHNYSNSDRVSSIQHKANVSGGTTTITVVHDSHITRAFSITAVEVSNAGASPTLTYAEYDNVTSTNPKYAAPSTGFSPPADSLVLAVFAFNAGVTSYTLGTGYTAIYSETTASPIGLSMYRHFTSAATNHQPDCTLGTAGRQGPASAIIIEGT